MKITNITKYHNKAPAEVSIYKSQNREVKLYNGDYDFLHLIDEEPDNCTIQEKTTKEYNFLSFLSAGFSDEIENNFIYDFPLEEVEKAYNLTDAELEGKVKAYDVEESRKIIKKTLKYLNRNKS